MCVLARWVRSKYFLISKTGESRVIKLMMIFSKCSNLIARTNRLAINQNHHIKVSLISFYDEHWAKLSRPSRSRSILRVDFSHLVFIWSLTGFELLLLAKFKPPEGLQRQDLQQRAGRSQWHSKRSQIAGRRFWHVSYEILTRSGKEENFYLLMS